jgi:hypothetical protein
MMVMADWTFFLVLFSPVSVRLGSEGKERRLT